MPQVYTFYLLLLSLVDNTGSYTKAVVYNNLNACTEAGQRINAPTTWRCQALVISETADQIGAKAN